MQLELCLSSTESERLGEITNVSEVFEVDKHSDGSTFEADSSCSNLAVVGNSSIELEDEFAAGISVHLSKNNI
jgi:hypothetical protein